MWILERFLAKTFWLIVAIASASSLMAPLFDRSTFEWIGRLRNDLQLTIAIGIAVGIIAIFLTWYQTWYENTYND